MREASICRSIALALVLALAVAPVMGAMQGPPGDLEVRTTRDTATDDTLTTLTLMLKGPKGPLPINLAITIRRKVRVSTGPPLEVRLDFGMPLFAGALDHTRPHAVFVLDKDTKDELSYPASAEPTVLMKEVTHLSVPSDMATLGRFAAATTIEGKVFGVAFVLTPPQLRAIKDFVK